MVKVDSIEDLKVAAQEFCDQIGGDRVFLFYGEMGAGKTTFIKEICNCLGVSSDVTSPTFTIVNEYPCNIYKFIYHFDFYRIEKVSEIFDIGFEEYLESNSLLFIEWPEKLGELLPYAARNVNIVEMQNGTREISW